MSESLVEGKSLSITKIGGIDGTVRIDYDGQTFLPWAEANQQIAEAAAFARADERERIRSAMRERCAWTVQPAETQKRHDQSLGGIWVLAALDEVLEGSDG